MLQKNKSHIGMRLLRAIIIIFILMNVVAAFHAYKFTHFNTVDVKTRKSLPFSIEEKLITILFGIDNPRPENTAKPTRAYETVKLQSNKAIEAWMIPAVHPKGTVILYHGYGGDKSEMLDKSDEFVELGYNTLLVDFMGAGNSEGNQTTIGYKEGEEVKTSYEYLKSKGEENIILFGTSMGAVAILKAINDYHLQPQSIIIQSPFGTLYRTVCARFNLIHVPSFPMAALLLFWGSIENGFWAFSHKPVEYAKQVTCPVLLMYGEKDIKVTRREINMIYKNITAQKTLKLFPLGGHENLLKYKSDWESTVVAFLDKHNHSIAKD